MTLESKKWLVNALQTAYPEGNEWLPTLEQVGFSPSGAKNLAQMTDAVLAGKTGAEDEVQYTGTTLPEYLRTFVASKE
ncbi:hypothetical protein LJC31_05915 [Synergistaceae bacterium OttesenSCG-928-I11]|nr:hypothetical protein [Synergistaceae bacterium OttesenSCG-928-I11]